jgi:hypothetical protein
MVGSTGTVQNDGSLKIKNGGLNDKIVNGHQFAKQEENILGQHKWQKRILVFLKWFIETFNDKSKVIPTS